MKKTHRKYPFYYVITLNMMQWPYYAICNVLRHLNNIGCTEFYFELG